MLLACLSLAPVTIPGEGTGSSKPGEDHPFVAMNLGALASGLLPASQFAAHCVEGARGGGWEAPPSPTPCRKTTDHCTDTMKENMPWDAGALLSLPTDASLMPSLGPALPSLPTPSQEEACLTCFPNSS